ncbi:leucine-rich repeat-containing protein [Tanacetum coccineum]
MGVNGYQVKMGYDLGFLGHTPTSLVHQPVVAAEGDVNTCIDTEMLIRTSIRRDKLFLISKLNFKTPMTDSLHGETKKVIAVNVTELHATYKQCPLIGNRLKDLTLPGNEFDIKLSNFLNNLSECSVAMLQYLDASSSQFTGSLSHEIQHFSSLTGVISENIGKSNLCYIDLSNNSLEGIPFNANMPNLSKNVDYIDFSSCKLGARYPEWIQKMKNLSHLDLSNNNISDTISIEYWNQWRPSRLHYLNLAFNNITGALPEFISNTNLSLKGLVLDKFYGLSMPDFPVGIKFLDLSSNKFHGEVSLLCQMYEGLEFLDLSCNSLTGPLLDCMWNLTKLTVLNLGHNHLSGRLPLSIGFLSQLETLSLYNNHFSGELPSSLENCTKLSLLDLGVNKFIGNVPVSIGKNLSRLYVLSLRSNNFFGTIPSQICQLVTLQILDLSINNLHGIIPSCVNNINAMIHKGFFVKQNLHHYQLSFDGIDHYSNGERVDNNYIDHVMTEWQGKVNEFGNTLELVKTIDLSSNNLTRQIPYKLTYLQGLVVLDLSHNTLVGEIPQDIGQMKELLTLNLSRNMFSREIPSTMSRMDRLNDLDVSYNNLSGRIPSSTQLQSFPP